MLRIWFNRTYSTNLHTIALLRENPDCESVRIYATHADLSSPVVSASDVAEFEPSREVKGDSYVDWALDFCVRHDIDVLIPRLHLVTIAEARERFAAHGVAIVAGPAAAATLLEDKAAAYADARAAGLAVPPYRVVATGEELLAAFRDLTAEVGTVCMKPVRGVGGEGFRILTESRLTLADLSGSVPSKVRVAEVAAALDRHIDGGGVVPPRLVMPLLPAPEVSVDCLADEEGNLLAAIPRTKSARTRLLVADAGAVEVARTIVARHKLSSLSNTQVRYWAHPEHDRIPRPYLLETNPRISGGLYQTAFTGLNLPWAAVRLAMGDRVQLPTPQLGMALTTVSTIVCSDVSPPPST